MSTKRLVSLFIMLAIVATAFLGFARPAAAQQAQDPTLTVLPQYVNAGDQFTVDVTLDTDGSAFIGWQFDYSWDPAVVRLDSVTEGPFIRDWVTSVGGGGTFFQAPIINQGAGTARGAAVTALAPLPANQGASGTGVIARMTFTALANGLSTNTLNNTILVLPGAIAYPGTIVKNGGFFQVGPAPRLVVTALGFTPVGAGEQFNVTFTLLNQGGMASPATTADISATGAAPTSYNVNVDPLQPNESRQYTLPITYQLDPGATSATVRVTLPDYGTSREAVYSPTSASGETDVDATFGAYLEITPPVEVLFDPLNIGGNDKFGDVNVKCNTSYAVDVYDNGASDWHLTKWEVATDTFDQTVRLTYDLIVKNDPQGLQVREGTPPRILTGDVSGQSGNSGQNFPLVFNTTRDIADPLLPVGYRYHMVLTWNAYITI